MACRSSAPRTGVARLLPAGALPGRSGAGRRRSGRPGRHSRSPTRSRRRDPANRSASADSWPVADDHQRDAFAVLAGQRRLAGVWISRPLAWSFVATVDPEFWAPGFDYLGFTPADCGRNSTDASTRIFGIDWRRIPIDVWLDVMADRELTGEQGPIPAALQRPAPLSRAAVRRRGPRRAAGPGPAGPAGPQRVDRITAGHGRYRRLRRPSLRAAILAGIDRVGEQQRNLPLGRVLDRTFVHAAPDPGGGGRSTGSAVLDLPAPPGQSDRRADRRRCGRWRSASCQLRRLTSPPVGRRMWAPIGQSVGLVGEQPSDQHDAVTTARGDFILEEVTMAEIVVVGAGLIGLSTALLLARDGHRVTVLETDPAPPPAAAHRHGMTGTARGSTSSASCTSCCRAGTRRCSAKCRRCSTN